MSRWIVAGLCAGLAACVPVDREPGRDVIGISAARSAAGNEAPDDTTKNLLEWKASQICTDGHDMVRQDIEPAEGDWQLVDWQFRCAYYTHVSLF